MFKQLLMEVEGLGTEIHKSHEDHIKSFPCSCCLKRDFPSQVSVIF